MSATFVYAIQFVADMEAALAFYRDDLGLTLKFATPFWAEFATGDITLALHPANADNPAGVVQLGFRVPDVAALYAESGLAFTAPPRVQSGALIAKIVGVDGREVSLSSTIPDPT